MTQRDWIFVVVAVFLTVTGGFLAAGETALQVVSRKRAERMVDDQMRGAERVLEIAKDPAPTINTSIFIRILCGTAAVVLVALVFFENFGHEWERIVLPLVLLTLIDFIAWSVVPRTLGRQLAERIALRSARPLSALTSLFGWLPSGLIVIGNVITPGPGYTDGPFTSEAELRDMVDMAEKADLIEHGERDMIHSVFELGDTLVREVMVPRTDVVFIESGQTLRQGLSLALRSGFSRIPVIGENLDDVRGIVYLKDLVHRVFDNPDAESSETVDQLMRAPVFCPDSKPVDDLMAEMQATRNHMVVVVDEFGGSAGVATIEDLVEEIVGEITDEYDAEPDLAQQLDDGSWRISSRMPLDDLGDLFDMELDDEDVETAGGLMAKELSRVPIVGSQVAWKGLNLIAETATGRRHQIDTIVVSKQPEPQDDDADKDDND